MKTKFYLLFILVFLYCGAFGQPCSSLQLTYTSTESRCVATGSITASVTGGSGSYNYMATGPVITPSTSSPVITGLPPGYYSVIVTDLVTNCVVQIDSAYVDGTYNDPRFQLTKTDATCIGTDGTISVFNRQFGRAPFTYTIIAPSPTGVGTTNSTGNFTGLIAGEYAIQLSDSCGGIQVRRVTIENYSWWFDSTSIIRNGCDSADVFIRLNDNDGNDNTQGIGFTGFRYGVVRSPGDTLFSFNYDFTFYLGTQRYVTIVVKDNCGNIQTLPWSLPDNVKPSLGNVVQTNFTCSTFTASIPVQQNLTNPDFCLFSGATLLSCNSTGTFNNLPFGDYCIKMTDLCYDTVITRCFNVQQPNPSVDATVNISNQRCATFTATITGQTNFINPYYCLFDSGNDTVACNSTGIFNNVPYGNYCIAVRNGCLDTIIVRCFTALRSVPTLTQYSISGNNCTSFDVSAWDSTLVTPLYCLYDSLGNVIACDSSGQFTDLPHGYYCIRAVTCGDTTAPLCFTGVQPVPSVGNSVQISNRVCSGFTATITGQTNLTAPQYCLHNSADSLLYCNTTGIFTNLAYGSYCIKIKDSCTDSTILRCFSQARLVPSIDANVQQSNEDCNTFTARVTGNNLTSPQYCITDTLGVVISCNTTGIFNNIPWGRYCFTIEDGCIDTTMTVCKTFSNVRGLQVATAKACVIGSAHVNIRFNSVTGPYNVRIYHPNGSLVNNINTSSNPLNIILPGLPTGARYKIIGTDNCGIRDTAFLTPDASAITKSIVTRGKCPSALWLNGAGDLQVNCSSNYYTATPSVIKKNGVVFNQSYSSVTGTVFTFADLEPATYIVEYNMITCNAKVYDTVTVLPYSYPTQGQSAIYQCDNSSLSLGADVQGGVTPFTYQIIGSTPSSPSITTGTQTSPLFSINNGTLYSLVRLRAVDACGNATLDDVSVLPLQNFTVAASQVCFYDEVSLSVNTMPNATYTWYRKTTPSDSTMVGNGSPFNLPFFVPEEVGLYVCKINIHEGCSIGTASFMLDGDCDNQVLASTIQLKGKENSGLKKLYWYAPDEQGITLYQLQRKRPGDNLYKTIATLPVQITNRGTYNYTDTDGGINKAEYRLMLGYSNGRTAYTNTILLQSNLGSLVYPNPVKSKLMIELRSATPAQFTLQLYAAGGTLMDTQQYRGITKTTVPYFLNGSIHPGFYFLKIINNSSGTTEIHKILVE